MSTVKKTEEKKNSTLKNASLFGLGILAAVKGPSLLKLANKKMSPQPSMLEKMFGSLGKITSGAFSGLADKATIGVSLLTSMALATAALYAGKVAYKGQSPHHLPTEELMHQFNKALKPVGSWTNKARSILVNYWKNILPSA